jgi:hypothetical protein
MEVMVSTNKQQETTKKEVQKKLALSSKQEQDTKIQRA